MSRLGEHLLVRDTTAGYLRYTSACYLRYTTACNRLMGGGSYLTFNIHKVTCEDCKKTAVYRNLLLEAELSG